MRKIPKDTKFLRFLNLPKDIVYEFIIKDLPFYMETDHSFKQHGKPTIKFAVVDRGEFDYLQRLIRLGGWEKKGALFSQT